MTGLLEMREKLKLIYSKNEVFIVPVVKFLLAFITLTVINGQLGYMTRLDSLPVVLIAALLCSFLPTGCIILFAAIFSLLHMYELSMEVALVGLCLYLVIALLFLRFSPKDAIAVLLTPMLFALKIPYVMPIAMGLLGTPASAVSVGCGVVIYYFLMHVIANATAIGTMDESEVTAKLKLMIDGLIDNKAMLVIIVAFAVTIIVVYLIRRMSVDYAWTIAMVTGAIIDLVLLLIGDLLYDTNVSVLSAILGSLAAILIAKILEFFRFCVDYSRTEKVQFEDDEYYYYVKAIPKMSVSAPTRTVKKLTGQKRSASVASRSNAGTGREGASRTGQSAAGAGRTGAGRTAAGGSRSGAGSSAGASGRGRADMAGNNAAGRRVVTERTPVRSNSSRQADTARRNSQQRVSINTNMVEDVEAGDDYEQWE